MGSPTQSWSMLHAAKRSASARLGLTSPTTRVRGVRAADGTVVTVAGRPRA